jgi:hypothetical protein
MGSSSVVSPSQLGVSPRELLELVGMPSEAGSSTKQLSGSANDLVGAVVSVLSAMVLRTMEERTAESFEKIRADVFPRYFAAMIALGSLLRVTVPEKDIAWLTAQSLSELEADFRDSGAAAFGEDLRDRGIFTVWILRKIYDLAEEMGKASAAGAVSLESIENTKQFAVSAVWARFHIDCLVKSMRSQKPIFPDVVDSIRDGLRGTVNAYAWLRREVDKQIGADVEPVLSPVEWDTDDELLLSDSMRDMLREEE